MNRRGFFGGLFGAGAAATGLAAVAGPDRSQGIWWKPECPMHWLPPHYYAACNWVGEAIFVDLTKPVHVPNQCPRCLSVLDLTELGKQIQAYNKGRNNVRS